MRRFQLFAALCLLCMSLHAADSMFEVVFENDFSGLSALPAWLNRPGVEYLPTAGPDKKGAVLFSCEKEQSNLCSIPLDVKKIAGNAVTLEGYMKGEIISKPRQSYLGPKLMIHVKGPSGESWIDQQKKYGTFDWEKFSVFTRVPENAEKVNLCLGLQGCTGKLYVSKIKITMLPKVKNEISSVTSSFKLPQKTAWRGVMSGSRMQEEDIRELAEKWKANLIRYQISNFQKQDITTEEKFCNWVDSRIPELDRVLALCGKYGIKVLIDLHSGPAAKQGELMSNQLAWTHESQNALVKVWEKLAARYKDNPTVWGYDILNEPREDNYIFQPGGPLDWNRLAVRVAKAIRKIDPKTPIIVEPAQWGSPAGLSVLTPIPVNNIIYSVHFYGPMRYTHQGIHGRESGFDYPGIIDNEKWDKNKIRKQLQPVVEFQDRYKVPIYIGEFSVVRWAPGAAQWLEDVISIFEENGWDWTYHAFREYDGWSVEHSAIKEEAIVPTTDRKEILLKYMQRNAARVSAPEEKLDIGSDALSHVENISSLNNFKLSTNDFRIYFIGNSITRHGVNNSTIENLKWDHIAGMAASSEDKDYAHLLAAMIAQKLPGRKVQLFFGKGHDSAGALGGLADAVAYQPHLIIVQLGEHAKPAGSVEKTTKDYNALLDALQQLKPTPLILCTGVWNPQLRWKKYLDWTAEVEKIQKEACVRRNIPFASVEKYALDKDCSGTGGSGGVKWHPNDNGMEGYARELFQLFKNHYGNK